MGYLVPFSVISMRLGLGAPPYHGDQQMPASAVMDVLRTLLRAVPVDEQWYCETYPDVAQAIAAGDYRNARHHFVADGYFEGRWPGPARVDTDWYLTAYPDVQRAVENGEVTSAQDHFDRHGYREGRAPNAADMEVATIFG
jgi:hypothetical protein